LLKAKEKADKRIAELENDIKTQNLRISDQETNPSKTELLNKIKELEMENMSLCNKLRWIQDKEEQTELKRRLATETKEKKELKDKLKQLEIEYEKLKKKSKSIRDENDILVSKLQDLHTMIVHKNQTNVDLCDQKTKSQHVKVSVSEFEDIEESSDEIFYTNNTTEHKPKKNSKIKKSVSLNESKSRSSSCCIHETLLENEDKRFEEAAQKIMRLEQRVITLQNANNVNSCASCVPLRAHVMKLEKELMDLASERKSQLNELFDLKQEALSGAVREKDAHLSWLEATGDGNVHTQESIKRLRKERSEILKRMKEENDSRMALLSGNEGSPIFTITGKIAALGAFGSFMKDVNEGSPGDLSTSSFQSVSAEDIHNVQFPSPASEDGIHLT